MTSIEDGGVAKRIKADERKPSSLATILTPTPIPANPRETYITDHSKKLDFYPDKEGRSTQAASLAVSSLPSTKPVTLPGIFMLKDRIVEIYHNQSFASA